MNLPKINIPFKERIPLLINSLLPISVILFGFDVLNIQQFTNIFFTITAFSLGRDYQKNRQKDKEKEMNEREELGNELLLTIKEKFPNEWQEFHRDRNQN